LEIPSSQNPPKRKIQRKIQRNNPNASHSGRGVLTMIPSGLLLGGSFWREVNRGRKKKKKKKKKEKEGKRKEKKTRTRTKGNVQKVQKIHLHSREGWTCHP